MSNAKNAIFDDGNNKRFNLARKTNGVYLVDGRSTPVCNRSAIGLDNSKSVVCNYHGCDQGVRIGGGQGGIDVKK